jgi:hypothetical protein
MTHRAADTGPLRVFADPRGRRRVIVRWLAIGACGISSSYVALASLGLLGGPQVPLLPWPHAQSSQTPGDPRGHVGGKANHGRQVAAGTSAAPTPSTSPSPAPGRSATPSPQPSPTGTTVTNRAGKTPPGRNGAASPSPHGTKPA